MSAHGYISNRFYSVEEYFEIEAKSELKYEYLDGADFVPINNSFNHNEIAANINQCLRNHFDRKEYSSFQETVQLEVNSSGKNLLPDVVLVRTADVPENGDAIKYPLLIAEVSATDTDAYDWNVKWRAYLQFSDLKYVLLVSQREPEVRLFTRTAPNTHQLEFFEQMDDVIFLPQLSFSISLHQIYNGIIFLKPIGLPMGLYSEE